MRWREPLEGPRDSLAGARAQEEFGESGQQPTGLDLGPQPARWDLGLQPERGQATPQAAAVLQPERADCWAVALPSSKSPREWTGPLWNQLARAEPAPPGPRGAKWVLEASARH